MNLINLAVFIHNTTKVKRMGIKLRIFVFRFFRFFLFFLFLVACYATLHPPLSVRWSVRHYFFIFADFGLTAPAQMIK